MSSKFLYFLLILPFQIQAQSINATTLNCTGMVGNSANGYSLTYSVGELASIAHFISNNNFSLNTGFLQTYIPLVTSINDLLILEGSAISIFPNPTTKFVLIKANFNKIGKVHLQLIDAESKIKYESEQNTIFNQFYKQLDISDFTSGIYYLRIQFQPNYGQSNISVYKIVKL